ncbi:MAG TPA: sodium ion-translocating decarboxylase subunit beta [Ruminococcaceae bacterium]|nr:sodium ion-translocating decarboxylase subunit beta [Oscillospiraceae bacterium]
MSLSDFGFLVQNFAALVDWRYVAMWVIGGVLIFLAIKYEMEPTLLLPLGFGTILVNIPFSGAVDRMFGGELQEGALSTLYKAGIDNELFPLILFIGIGAMIDFGPLLSNPKLMIFGAAAQFGIFFTFCAASMFFDLNDAASIGIIGAADGPTSIFVAQYFNSKYIGAIMVAAYSYMALVPVIQPPIMKMLTTENERKIRMAQLRPVSKTEKIIFPILVITLCGILLPSAVPLMGALMFGNLAKECGVLGRLADTMQNALMNTVTIFLGLSVGSKMAADKFLNLETLGILLLGAVAFSFGTAAGVLLGKLMNKLDPKHPINPLIGAAGVSAVPMAARVASKVGQEADSQNFLLMHAMGPNVSGVIGSAVAAGVLLAVVPGMMESIAPLLG